MSVPTGFWPTLYGHSLRFKYTAKACVINEPSSVPNEVER
jgi:hypothetical protein